VSERAREFGELLAREREAALHADIDALTEVQERKRAVLSELRSSPVADSDISQLIARAHENIGLIRHLIVCLRGCLGAEAEPTYSASGERKPQIERGFRGVL
jgi:hypothetical protein